MGTIRSSFQLMRRAIIRRKVKNLSIIFAIFLGVTILVGVQITSSTIESSFLTTLLHSQGEVDITISNRVQGNYLNSTDLDNIKNFTSNIDFEFEGKNYEWKNALGIMPILLQSGPVALDAQFEPKADIAGIPLDYDKVFGNFYDWKTDKVLDISTLLSSENAVIMSSELAENLALELNSYPEEFIIQTEFLNITFDVLLNTTIIETYAQNLTIKAIYNSNRPGIGAQFNSQTGRLVISIGSLQELTKFGSLTRELDRISSFYINYKENHFTEGELPLEVLELIVNKTLDKVPKYQKMDINGTLLFDKDGKPILEYRYSVTSLRLTFFEIADAIGSLMNSFLTALGVLIIATGLLLITNIQLMSVEDREFQTGVLRAIGENRSGILRIYLLETIFQGILGGLLGLVGGLIFGWVVALYLSSMFGSGFGTVVPVVQTSLVTYSVIVGVVIAIVTGISPALRASRVNIVEALRGIKTTFEEKSSRNYFIIGIIITLLGVQILLRNGFSDTTRQYIWETAGWDSIAEQETIILGLGILFTGIGFILSRYINRTKAINITAIVLWGLPVSGYLLTLSWVESGATTGGPGGNTSGYLLISILEIIVGSVLLVGLNLGLIMDALRSVLIKINFLKGVAQISPAMIKSHRTRSTLTFAIFAVVLTLNVMIASIVATQTSATIGKADEDSRGIDLIVTLSKPEDPTHPYSEEIKKLNEDITDIIPLRTCVSCINPVIPLLVSFVDPESPEFNPNENILPMKLIELNSEQIRGEAKDSSDPNWRYDIYLDDNKYPDEVREEFKELDDINDENLLDLSRKSWDKFLLESYTMPAYNVTPPSFTGGSFGSNANLDEIDPLYDNNGDIIRNPIIFTDSFFLQMGLQVWIPMNVSSEFGTPTLVYQKFTIGGVLDRQRAGGFPLSPSGFGESDDGTIGSIFISDYWTQYTSYFGNATSIFSTPPRDKKAYDSYLIKTVYSISDPAIRDIAQQIEEFTNTNNATGYRTLIDDNLIRATSITMWSKIESSLSAMNTMTNFLQIYVSFGLIIGTLGMSVIAVRNVAERKREIGMMRAIGFPKGQVMFAVLLELMVLGIIGLIIGVSNGIIINVGLANLSNNAVTIPWNTIIIYLGFITFVAALSGAIPGWIAAKIPPSEALRYTG